MYRTIDANINRLREAIRVIEDILRFEYNDSALFKNFKTIRHDIENFLSGIEKETIMNRESSSDIGEKSITESEMKREDIYSVVKANFIRAEEASRVLEEAFKTIDNADKSEKAKSIRFKMYTLEQSAIKLIKGWK